MSHNKQTVEEHRENEEVTAAGEPFSPEITPDEPTMNDASGQETAEKLRSELAEMKDKFLRVYSEFDNFRKRTSRERSEMIKSAGSDVIMDLLPVLDDFERALKAMETAGTTDKTIRSGVELIFHKLRGTLEQKGLKRMVSIGEVFDMELHDAVTNIPAADEKMKGRVVDEVECGYFLNEKVLRHAKVIVGI